MLNVYDKTFKACAWAAVGWAASLEADNWRYDLPLEEWGEQQDYGK